MKNVYKCIFYYFIHVYVNNDCLNKKGNKILYLFMYTNVFNLKLKFALLPF